MCFDNLQKCRVHILTVQLHCIYFETSFSLGLMWTLLGANLSSSYFCSTQYRQREIYYFFFLSSSASCNVHALLVFCRLTNMLSLSLLLFYGLSSVSLAVQRVISGCLKVLQMGATSAEAKQRIRTLKELL